MTDEQDEMADDVRRLATMLSEMRSRVYPLFPLGDDPSVSTIAPWHVLAYVRKSLHNYETVIDRYLPVKDTKKKEVRNKKG
jgi:hypothetical protein